MDLKDKLRALTQQDGSERITIHMQGVSFVVPAKSPQELFEDLDLDPSSWGIFSLDTGKTVPFTEKMQTGNYAIYAQKRDG